MTARINSGANPGATATPVFEIEIAGKRLGEDVTRLVERVSYESADGIADVGKLLLANPDGILTDKKIIQPGNEAKFFFGYDLGGEIGRSAGVAYVGRVQFVRPTFHFTERGMPTIEIVGYTRDHQMMDNSPERKKPRTWKQATLFTILEDKASVYGFHLDVDDFDFGRSITQKPGMSDYALVRGLANYLGYIFWVDGTEDGRWILHFKDPKRSRIDQEVKYTLRYDFGNQGSILSFEPEFAIRDARTKIRCEARNPDTGVTMSETFEDDAAQPDMKSDGDMTDEVDIAITSGGAVKLFFGEHSIEVIANKRFRSPAELRRWASQWFERNRENFVIGQGKAIGIETIMARHTHRIEGLGRTLDGDYYFARVEHQFSREEGYKLDFTARKEILDSRAPQTQSARRVRTFREAPI